MKRLAIGFTILIGVTFIWSASVFALDIPTGSPEEEVPDNGTPDIDVQRGESIPNNGTDDIDYRNMGPVNLTYTIENKGTATLNVASPTGTNPKGVSNFQVTQAPPTTFSIGSTDIFSISFDVDIIGDFSIDMNIGNNDPDENPYTITIAGTSNTPPTITDIPNQTTTEDTPTPPIPFTIGDAETSPYNLGVRGSSQNKSLIPDENIVFGGEIPNLNVTLTPAPNAFGATMISIFVNDPQGAYAKEDFWISVTPVNDPPVLGDIPNQTTNEDVPLQFDLDLNDVDNSFGDLALMGSNYDSELVDNIGFTMLTPKTVRKTRIGPTATITPVANASGETDVVISASDGEYTVSDTFHLTINPVNDAPQFLMPLPPVTLIQGEHYEIPMVLLYQIVEDVDDPDPTLVWSVTDHERFTPVITSDLIMFDAPSDWTGTDTLTVTVSDGELSDSEPLIVSVVTTVGETAGPAVPTSFALFQNHPNPFNPVTTITFGLPRSSHVTLTIYNNRGQVTRILVDENRNAGYHSIQWDASDLPSGIYIYHIQAEGFTMVRKCMLMK